MVERNPEKVGVAGSLPARSTNRVAERAESNSVNTAFLRSIRVGSRSLTVNQEWFFHRRWFEPSLRSKHNALIARRSCNRLVSGRSQFDSESGLQNLWLDLL